ncbi:MAG: LysM domain, partial [Ilumatobacteraceae bacterium]
MQRVSDDHSGAGAPAASTRSRWLFALVVFSIGIVPVTEIATAVGPSNASACPGATYSVVKGDSWSKIASRAKVTLAALIKANAATTATVIHPGQTVCLPSGAPVVATPTTTVAP